MAVTQKGFFFQGLSGDTKPTTGITTSDRFLETNTGKEFVWSGAAWVPALSWTANKLLKGAGAGVDPTEIDVPITDIFDKFREFIPWVSLDGFTISGSAGFGSSIYGTAVRLYTGAVLDDYVYLTPTTLWHYLIDVGKTITVELIISNLVSALQQNIWLHLSNALGIPPSELADHFGWKLIGGAAVTDLYASNGNGAAQTITDTAVDIAASLQRTRLKMVFTPGTDVKFYVNDVLKVTHTTNLPVLADQRLYCFVQTKQAVAKEIWLGRVLLEKAHA